VSPGSLPLQFDGRVPQIQHVNLRIGRQRFVKRVFKAHRLLCHPTLGLRVIKKNKICKAHLVVDGRVGKEGLGALELLPQHPLLLRALLAIQSSGVSHRNVRRFRGGLAFKAHRLCVSLNSRLESNKEEEVRACGQCMATYRPMSRAAKTLNAKRSGDE